MIVVDAHAHIHKCFDISYFLKSAYYNLKTKLRLFKHDNSFTGTLLLVDTPDAEGFRRLLDLVNRQSNSSGPTPKSWSLCRTNEETSLRFVLESGENIVVIAGRQIVSKENLEVLAIGTCRKFGESDRLKVLIREIDQVDAVPIIPWGVGKWIGKRGQIVEDLIHSSCIPQFFLGDNANRPAFWSRPPLFRKGEEKGIKNLPGSDPLPFPGEARRVGQFGFAMKGSLDSEAPTQDLRRRLLDSSATIHQFGSGETLFRFLHNQMRIQYHKFTGL